MKKKYIIILISFVVLFGIVAISYSIKDVNKRNANDELYLQTNELYMSGIVSNVVHLNSAATSYFFYITIDSLCISKQNTNETLFIGIRNIVTNEACVFIGFMHYYDFRNPKQNYLPEKIIIDTKKDEILYINQNEILGKDGISIDILFAKPQFNELISEYLDDPNWVRF
jgi:hypothetical protein